MSGFSAAGGGSMTLLHAGSGTDTNAAAANVDTVAISGLTVSDLLYVVIIDESVTQQTAKPMLYSATDSLQIAKINGDVAVAAATIANQTVTMGVRQGSSVALVSNTVGNDSLGTNLSLVGLQTLTTLWTSAWTLALRHSGVTAGGTFKYRWAVYKLAGQ